VTLNDRNAPSYGIYAYRVAQIKIPHRTKCNFSTTVWDFYTQIYWFIWERSCYSSEIFKKYFSFIHSYGCINILCHIFNSARNNQQQLVIFKRGGDIPTGNPPNGGVECRWGMSRNRDSGLIAGYRRLLDVRSAKNMYWRRSWVYDTVGHAPLAIDRLLDVRTTKWRKQLPTTMQCKIAQSATHQRIFVCNGLQHGRRRREENRKEFNCTQWYIWSRNN